MDREKPLVVAALVCTAPFVAAGGFAVLLLLGGTQVMGAEARRWLTWWQGRRPRTRGVIALAETGRSEKRSTSSRRLRPLLFGPAREQLRWSSSLTSLVRAVALLLQALATALLPGPMMEFPERQGAGCLGALEEIGSTVVGGSATSNASANLGAFEVIDRAFRLATASFPAQATDAETVKGAVVCWTQQLGWSGALTATSLSFLAAAGLCKLIISLVCIIVLLLWFVYSSTIYGVSKAAAYRKRRRRCAFAVTVRDSNKNGTGGEGEDKGDGGSGGGGGDRSDDHGNHDADSESESSGQSNKETGRCDAPAVSYKRQDNSGIRSVPTRMAIELTRNIPRLRANSRAFSHGVDEYE